MKILIPTAKEMNTELPSFELYNISEKSRGILNELLNYDTASLAKLYKIKEEQAKKEKERLENIVSAKAKTYEALYLFDGLMYRSISRLDFDKDDLTYLKDKVYITSSLYGIISVFDRISEHRLDFMQNIKVDGLSLKKLWAEDYDNFLKGEEVVISLLSSEFEEVFSKAAREKLLNIKFMEEKAGVLKVHSTISKKARGKFLSALVKNKINKISDIKKLKFENYKFEESLSTEKEFVFVDREGK